MRREDAFLIEQDSAEFPARAVRVGPRPESALLQSRSIQLRNPVLALDHGTVTRMAEASARLPCAVGWIVATNRLESARNIHLRIGV